MKERYDVIASSLSSYFGVGFNTVQEQLDYDLGKEERVVDEEAQDRMNLGIALEDGCLNYFEQKMGIKIDERNSEYKYAFNDQLKCKRDGRTFIESKVDGWIKMIIDDFEKYFKEKYPSYYYFLFCNVSSKKTY